MRNNVPIGFWKDNKQRLPTSISMLLGELGIDVSPETVADLCQRARVPDSPVTVMIMVNAFLEELTERQESQ